MIYYQYYNININLKPEEITNYIEDSSNYNFT